MFEILLEESKKDNCYIAIYSNLEEKSKFIYGKLIGLDDDYFAIESISPSGHEDGILIKEISNIFKIEKDSLYSEKIQSLMNYNYKTREKMCIIDDTKLLESVLEYAQANKLIVSVELLDSGCDDAVGFIYEIKDKICKINQVNEYGYNDGSLFISLNDISRLSVDSCDEKIIQKLWETNYCQ